MERIPDDNRSGFQAGPSIPSASAMAGASPSGMAAAPEVGASVPTSPESVASRVAAARKAAEAKVKDSFRAPELPEICREIAARIPYSHVADDRILFAIEQIHKISAGQRMELRKYMDALVEHTLRTGASDIDFGGPAANGWIWYRVHGDKTPDKRMGQLSIDESNVLILSVLAESARNTLINERAVDFSYSLPREGARNARFRATSYFDLDSLALNMRSIPEQTRALSSLEFHPLIEKGLMFRHVRDGLTLVTGVTGSGKSTTLDSVIDANNDDVEAHVVIIAKPVEFMHESRKCIIRHREVGRDVRTFKEGIVHSLRQDPDIVVIGEMRDPSTISAALEITDSGHKVFSTLHTSSAVESLDRIVAEYPPDEQDRVRNRLADVLRCVISQKLLPRVGGGRILAKEVLWMTPSSRAAIKNQNTGEIYQMMWEGWNQGMITLEQDLFRLMRQGRITTETAINFANNKRRLNQLLK